MIKRFCDRCGVLIEGKNQLTGGGKTRQRLFTQLRSKDSKHILSVEVLTSLDNCVNDGDFCKYCVLDALYQLDDRSKDK